MKFVINNGFIGILLLHLPGLLFADQALLEYYEGEVTVVRGSDEFFAEFGEPLDPGDLVETGSGSIAVIRINDNTQVKLREETTLWIESVTGGPAVTLQSGGVFARVAKTIGGMGRRIAGFEVKTPTVVAGVRGTEFFVAYGRTVDEAPDLWLCVNEGVVDVAVPSTGEVVTVKEGEGINILAGLQATEPRYFPWTDNLNWNFDPDTGNIVDDTNLDSAYADLLDQDYD